MRKIRAIIVDDELFVAKSLEALIDWDAHAIELAGAYLNAADALAAMEKHAVDLVICDVRMPGMSGLDLVRHIKETCVHTETIIISGYTEFDYVKKALDYGASGYCLKPFDHDEVTDALNTALGKIRQSRESQNSGIGELLMHPHSPDEDKARTQLEEAGIRTERPFWLCVIRGVPRAELEPQYPIHFAIDPQTDVFLLQPEGDQKAVVDSMGQVCERHGCRGGLVLVESVDKLHSAMDVAMQCTLRSFIDGRAGLTMCSKVERMPLKLIAELIHQFMSCTSREQAVRAISSFFEENPYTISDVYLFFRMFVQDVLGEAHPILDEVRDYAAMTEEFGCLRDMLATLYDAAFSDCPIADASSEYIQKIIAHYYQYFVEYKNSSANVDDEIYVIRQGKRINYSEIAVQI